MFIRQPLDRSYVRPGAFPGTAADDIAEWLILTCDGLVLFAVSIDVPIWH